MVPLSALVPAFFGTRLRDYSETDARPQLLDTDSKILGGAAASLRREFLPAVIGVAHNPVIPAWGGADCS
jgi:hypothetical protein